MGQSLSSRRAPPPTPTPTPAAAPAPNSEPANAHRRSLPRRIAASLSKPSLRSRPLSSLTLPPRPEQTLRGKKRRWSLSRGRNVPAHTEGAVPEHMRTLPEHDEHHADRDVDEFGVVTHRVPDSHIHSPAPSAKGKERANDADDIDDIDEDDDEPVPSSSTMPPLTQPESVADRGDDDEQVVISPPVIPSSPPPLPPAQESEHPFLQPTPSQPSSQQANTAPRPFPPPGTLVVVQGVVHTTDVPRSTDRPVAMSNPTPLTTDDALNLNTGTGIEPNSTRPSSVPPGTRSRNPLSGILPRPTSMIPTVPSPPPPESAVPSSNAESQIRSNANRTNEDNEDEDRTHTHPHGVSMAQGPVGGSGLSASSVDVLGTLLSVAAAATAASLLTGSSEPIFSSGLTPSPLPPSSNSIPQHVPSERPLSPTPTSDAGRMRHVWSSLRDRLGLGGGTHNSNHSNDATFGSGQGLPPQLSDVVRPRDPREIMLAEMARAFNLGLGLSGTTTGTPSTAAANSNPPEIAAPEDVDAPPRDRDGEHSLLPPPDSFERFLMDLQSDLRVTLMQEQEPGVARDPPRDVDETVDDAEDDPMPELRSISDSDSEDYETRHFDSEEEDEIGYEEDEADDDEEDDVRITQEQPVGRTSPAVFALGQGIHSPLGIGSRPGSTSSFSASGVSLPHTAPSQILPTAVASGSDGKMAANNFSTDKVERQDIDAMHPSSSSTVSGVGSGVPADEIRQSRIKSGEEAEGQREEPVIGVAHSPEASNGGQRGEAEGADTILGASAVPPLDAQHSSYVPGAGTGQESSLLGTSSSPGPLTSTSPTLPGRSASATQVPSQPTNSSSPPSWDPEPITQSPSSTHPTPPDSSMPFRLPFMPSSASRTERTPGGGINWWRMYRFPAIASPNTGQHGSQGSSPFSQAAFRTPAQDPHTSAPFRASSPDHSQQNEVTTPRGVAHSPSVHTGLTEQAWTPSAATSAETPELGVNTNQNASSPPPTSGEDPISSSNTSTHLPEHRSNVVVPVIVVGLQSVNADRHPPHLPHPHVNHPATMDDEDGEAMDFDGSEQPMSVPLHIPEPPEFRHRSSPSNATQQEQGGQLPVRGRTWQSRAANAFRNLRPSRRNADTTSPQPQETPGSRTFLIYVIGGYYPPDHQIITGGNLDSFEALWELAELLGQVKPPTVSKEEIEKSGLEIIKASILEEYEKEGRVASNCTERCLICLDDYNPDDELRLLTCRHTFHQGCVDRWLETGRNNCPACRTKGVGNENAGPSPSEPAIA